MTTRRTPYLLLAGLLAASVLTACSGGAEKQPPKVSVQEVVAPAAWAEEQAKAFAELTSSRGKVQAPDCGTPVHGERVKLTADETDAVSWCVGENAGALVLKVTNARETYAAVQYPSAWGKPKAVEGLLDGASVDRFWATRGAEVAGKKGRSVALIAGGATLELAMPPEPAGSVAVALGPVVLMTTLAQYGVESYLDAAKAAGAKAPEKTWDWVSAALAGQGDPAIRPAADACRLAIAPMVGAQPVPEHTAAVAKAVLGCVPGLLADLAGEDEVTRSLYDAASAAVAESIADAWAAAVGEPADGSFDLGVAAARLELADLRGAAIPASCTHPATRVVNGSRDWGMNGSAEIVLGGGGGKAPVLSDVTGDGRQDAVVVMTCNAGGVSWPEWLLLYGPGAELLGAIDLGKGAPPAEHADVRSFRRQGKGIAVQWDTYEGAGYSVRRWNGTASWADGKWSLGGVSEDRGFNRCNAELEEAVHEVFPDFQVEVARCDGQWAYIGDAMGMGDTEQLYRYGDNWYRYTGFPTALCPQEVRADGAPQWVVDLFAYRAEQCQW